MGSSWTDHALLMFNWDLKSAKAVGAGLSGVLEQATNPKTMAQAVANDKQAIQRLFDAAEKTFDFIGRHLSPVLGQHPRRLTWLLPNGGILCFHPIDAMHRCKP